MAESSYPGYAFSGGSPSGYHYAGSPPGYTSALAGGFTSAISDFAALRQQAEMRAYEESRRYTSMSTGRAIMMSMGMYNHGVPYGREFGRTIASERLTEMGSTAAIYGGALAAGGGMMWAGSKLGMKPIAGGVASRLTTMALGRSSAAMAASKVVGAGAGLFGWGLPIMAATEIASQAIDYRADRYATQNDVRSMADRMQPTGFGNRNQIGMTAGLRDISTHVTDRSRSNDFFGKQDMLKIHKMGLSSGLLKGSSTTEYKKNFDSLVNAAKDMVTMLNTTLEGGMTVMSQVKNSIGLTRIGDIKNYISRSAQMGQLSGHGTQNMLAFGQAGAEQVRGTGLSGLTGATMMQNSIVQARQMLTMNPQLKQSYMDLGGTAGVGQMMMRTQANVLNSNMGKMTLASIMDPTTGKLDEAKYQRLASGKMSAGEIASAGSGRGWNAATRKMMDLRAPKLINEMGAEKARIVSMQLFESWGKQFGSQFKNKDFRMAAAQQYSEMFIGQPVGQSLMGTGNFSGVEAYSTYLNEGLNGPTARRMKREAKRIEQERNIGMNTFRNDDPGFFEHAGTGWRNVKNRVWNPMIKGIANALSNEQQLNPGVSISSDIFKSKAYAAQDKKGLQDAIALQTSADNYYNSLSSNKKGTYRQISGKIMANTNVIDAYMSKRNKDKVGLADLSGDSSVGSLLTSMEKRYNISGLSSEEKQAYDAVQMAVQNDPKSRSMSISKFTKNYTNSTAALEDSKNTYKRMEQAEAGSKYLNITNAKEYRQEILRGSGGGIKAGKSGLGIMGIVSSGGIDKLTGKEMERAATLYRSLVSSGMEGATDAERGDVDKFVKAWESNKKAPLSAESSSIKNHKDKIWNQMKKMDASIESNVKGSFFGKSDDVMKGYVSGFSGAIKARALKGGFDTKQDYDNDKEKYLLSLPESERTKVSEAIDRSIPYSSAKTLQEVTTKGVAELKNMRLLQEVGADKAGYIQKFHETGKWDGKLKESEKQQLLEAEADANEYSLQKYEEATKDVKSARDKTNVAGGGSSDAMKKEDNESLKTIASNTSTMVSKLNSGGGSGVLTWN